MKLTILSGLWCPVLIVPLLLCFALENKSRAEVASTLRNRLTQSSKEFEDDWSTVKEIACRRKMEEYIRRKAKDYKSNGVISCMNSDCPDEGLLPFYTIWGQIVEAKRTLEGKPDTLTQTLAEFILNKSDVKDSTVLKCAKEVVKYHGGDRGDEHSSEKLDKKRDPKQRDDGSDFIPTKSQKMDRAL